MATSIEIYARFSQGFPMLYTVKTSVTRCFRSVYQHTTEEHSWCSWHDEQGGLGETTSARNTHASAMGTMDKPWKASTRNARELTRE